MDAQSHNNRDEQIKKSNIPQQGNEFEIDPIITYDHMSDDAGNKNRYFYLPVNNLGINLWPLFFEELIIALLFALLVLTN